MRNSATVSKNVRDALALVSFLIEMNGWNTKSIINEDDLQCSIVVVLDVNANVCCICIKGIVDKFTNAFQGLDTETSGRVQELFCGDKLFTSCCHQASPRFASLL